MRSCSALVIVQVLDVHINNLIDSHTADYPHFRAEAQKWHNSPHSPACEQPSLDVDAGLAACKAMLFSTPRRGWGGVAVGSDPPGPSHSRRAASMLWPRQACVSRTYLPEVVPPALVSAKWGARGGQGGRVGRRGFWATPRALVTGHPISTPPHPQQVSFR